MISDLIGQTLLVNQHFPFQVNESGLRKLSDKLKEGSVDHKLWVEQPENYPTCLATRPYPKQEVQHFFKKLKLFRGPPLAVDGGPDKNAAATSEGNKEAA